MVGDNRSKVTPRDIIEKIVEKMHENCVEFPDYYLAPGCFYVYLHAESYKQLEGAMDRIWREAAKKLDSEIERLNAEYDQRGPSGKLRNLIDDWFSGHSFEHGPNAGRRAMQYKPPVDGWQIIFDKIDEEDFDQGKVEIKVSLAANKREELPEHNLTTPYNPIDHKRALTETSEEPPASHPTVRAGQYSLQSKIFAVIRYQDQRGDHFYEVKKSPIVIGRGGTGYWVDLRLDTEFDVSREHLRLRRDEIDGKFYIKDLSRLGTTVNGKQIPGSIDYRCDTRIDKNIELELPARAKIVLADVLVLEFEAA